MEASNSAPARVSRLSRDECEQVLAAQSIGRVGFVHWDGGIWVLPVTYVYANGAVTFRTAREGLLSRLVHRMHVAIEVEAADETGAIASVVCRGFSRELHRPHLQLGTLREERLVPWAPGPRTLVISVEADTISGVRLASPDAGW